MDLVEFCTALALIDDTNAELHDKEVTLTTSDVTGSQTAIFEYDPQNEPVSGDPAGPWDGYSLFTIDLSSVKDDIAAMQAQIAALEDELEDCHDCRDAVVAAIQEYDPDYDPAEGECPAPKVGEIVDHAQDCDDCKAEVVAKLQEYDPNFDPQTCEDIVDEIDDVYQKGRDDEEEENPPGYTFPAGVEIPDEVFTDFHTQIEDMDMPNTTVDFYAKIRTQDVDYGEYSYQYKPLTDKLYNADYLQYYAAAVFFMVNINGTEYNLCGSNGYALKASLSGSNWYIDIDTWDRQTGEFDMTVYMSSSLKPDNWSTWHSQTRTYSQIAGYGDPSHTYTVRNN